VHVRAQNFMTMYGGLEVKLNALLIPQVDGDEWKVSCLGHFTPRKEPLYPSARGLDASKKLFGHCAEVYNRKQCKYGIKFSDDGKLIVTYFLDIIHRPHFYLKQCFGD
jgi:hypothetical protein